MLTKKKMVPYDFASLPKNGPNNEDYEIITFSEK